MLNIQNQFQFNFRSRLLLFVGLLGFLTVILFPYGLLAGRSSAFDFVIYGIFGSQLSHVIAHFTAFGILGTAVFLLIPNLIDYPPVYFLGMIIIGFMQEYFQLTTFKARSASYGELFDLLVDLSAATAVYLLFWTIYKVQEVRYRKNK
jgi:hypothetical protein